LTQIPQVSVIVPTFQEAGNLSLLIPRIGAALDKAALSHEIVVVDDDSQDGTTEVCENLAREFPLRLLTRVDQRGLATAVIDGLDAAAGDRLVVMDADLSHPPESIAELVRVLDSPAVDFVIGSRYVPGGQIDAGWTGFRRLNSGVATLLARGLTRARDPMAGFFALHRSTYARAGTLRPLGYKIGLELIVRCNCQQLREVPITFLDRAFGKSKMDLGQQWLYLRHLGRLYLAKFTFGARALFLGARALFEPRPRQTQLPSPLVQPEMDDAQPTGRSAPVGQAAHEPDKRAA